MTPLPATPNRPERRQISRCAAPPTPDSPNNPVLRTAPSTPDSRHPSRAQPFKTSLLQGPSRQLALELLDSETVDRDEEPLVAKLVS